METDGDGARPYRSARRVEQARQTRQRLVAAATATFLVRGYAGTTMRAVAAAAGVSVPTIEQQFGTKVRLLKAAIDVAIAGDDDEVPVLDRAWADKGRAAGGVVEFVGIVADVLASAQNRSAGLVLAVLEGAASDPDLAELATTMISQRASTAGWIIDQLAAKAPLRGDLDRDDAVDTLWILMDPAVFDRLVRQRGWSVQRYQQWFARSALRLLIADHRPIETDSNRRR
ncbi:MAG TPA: TetR family transcriptional regulator [Kineosporiaceae bacterium]|nr:TetR family transcriptional regulator [Kineosporiaceae bacterium]